ncbi:MAG: hypothetical protein NTU47_04315 [Ignavibacteriales bacterium]|nr:hypothetical protein [Ignavibacteriales bacterium]
MMLGQRARGIKFQKGDKNHYFRNLNEFEELSQWIDQLGEIAAQYPPDSTVKPAVESLKVTLGQELENFSKEFKNQYGELPQGARRKVAKYSNQELALMYLEYCSQSGKSLPSTPELESGTPVSQPTWHRAYKRKSFWLEVRELGNQRVDEEVKELKKANDRKDLMVKAANDADDKLLKLKEVTETNKRDDVDLVNVASIEEIDSYDIDDKIDAKDLIDEMTRPQLIRAIVNERPDIIPGDLEREPLFKLRTLLAKLLFP